jgi:hypothetical protein
MVRTDHAGATAPHPRDRGCRGQPDYSRRRLMTSVTRTGPAPSAAGQGLHPRQQGYPLHPRQQGYPLHPRGPVALEGAAPRVQGPARGCRADTYSRRRIRTAVTRTGRHVRSSRPPAGPLGVALEGAAPRGPAGGII